MSDTLHTHITTAAARVPRPTVNDTVAARFTTTTAQITVGVGVNHANRLHACTDRGNTPPSIGR